MARNNNTEAIQALTAHLGIKAPAPVIHDAEADQAKREAQIGQAAAAMRDARASLERLLNGTADEQDKAAVASSFHGMCDLFA